MTDITADMVAKGAGTGAGTATGNAAEPPRKPLLRRMLPVLLPLLALGAGDGSTYAGLWSPLALLQPSEPAPNVQASPAVVFVDVPRIVLSLPGTGGRSLVVTALIDIDPAAADQARLLMPRLVDAFTTFLSHIDPAALDRRGILEILRAEMATRARFVLGDQAVRDLLITEFRIQ